MKVTEATLYQSFENGLSIADNLKTDVYEINFTENLIPIDLKKKKTGKVIDVKLAQIYEQNDPYGVLGVSVWIEWVDTGTSVRIKEIGNLTSGTLYFTRFILYYE